MDGGSGRAPIGSAGPWSAPSQLRRPRTTPRAARSTGERTPTVRVARDRGDHGRRAHVRPRRGCRERSWCDRSDGPCRGRADEHAQLQGARTSLTERPLHRTIVARSRGPSVGKAWASVGSGSAHRRDGDRCPDQGFAWSGRRDSNPRPSPWQGDALPAEPRPREAVRIATPTGKPSAGRHGGQVVRMLIARASTTAMSTTERVDWTIIAIFAGRVRGMTSVGLKAVAFVKAR